MISVRSIVLTFLILLFCEGIFLSDKTPCGIMMIRSIEEDTTMLDLESLERGSKESVWEQGNDLSYMCEENPDDTFWYDEDGNLWSVNVLEDGTAVTAILFEGKDRQEQNSQRVIDLFPGSKIIYAGPRIGIAELEELLNNFENGLPNYHDIDDIYTSPKKIVRDSKCNLCEKEIKIGDRVRLTSIGVMHSSCSATYHKQRQTSFLDLN